MTDNNYICYCITDSHNKYSYVGITNNFKRRHRQHNGEIKGGAKYTRSHRPWNTLFHVHGLGSHKHVLQLEWAIKHRRRKGYKGPTGRIRTLEWLLTRDRWTKKAPKIDSFKEITIHAHCTEKQYLKYAGLYALPKRDNVKYLFK